MSDVKEIHFFNKDAYLSRQQPNYLIYHSFFNPRPSHRLLGEATPYYMFSPNVRKRIHTYNPAMKFILLLRNPIERAYSDWKHVPKRGQRGAFFLGRPSERVR